MFTVRRREATAHPGRGRSGCGVLDDGREPGTATGESHPRAWDSCVPIHLQETAARET